MGSWLQQLTYNKQFGISIQHSHPRSGLGVQDLGPLIQPQAGTLMALPRFDKARSIAHAHRLMEGREVSVERKYDGEYCQMHVWVDSDHPKVLPAIATPCWPPYDDLWELAGHGAKCASSAFCWVSLWCGTAAYKTSCHPTRFGRISLAKVAG